MRFPKLLALGAGGVSALGFAPLGWWQLATLCIAMVMHLVWIAPGWRSAAARGYWFGVGHFTVGLNWIAGSFQYQETMPHWLGWFAVVALALYLAVYPAICAGFARALFAHGSFEKRAMEHSAERVVKFIFRIRIPPTIGEAFDRSLANRAGWQILGFVLVFAAGWMATEYLRAVMFTGFAWNPLGVAFVGVKPVGLAKFIGTLGLSGLFVMCSAVGFATFHNFRIGMLLFAAYIVGDLGGAWSKEAAKVLPSPPRVIRIVQPNIGQQDKHKEEYDAVNFAKLAGLTGRRSPEPRLILWPEAAVPDYLGEPDAEALAAREKLVALIGPKDVLLTGAVKLETRDVRRGGYIERSVIGARNSMFALTPDAKIVARYDKAHLVPYGEYLPMTSVLSAIGLSRLVPGTVDFWPGPGARTVDLPGFGKMGVQICYEIIFSGQVVDRANRPDFLFNPSNDAWFGSWGPPQHLAQAQLRAIEEGIPVIRATPTGISAVIDGNGFVLHKLPYQKPGFIEAHLPPPHEPTLFARYGNLLSLGFAALLGALGIALSRFRR